MSDLRALLHDAEASASGHAPDAGEPQVGTVRSRIKRKRTGRAVAASALGATALVSVVSLGAWAVGLADTTPAPGLSPSPTMTVSPSPAPTAEPDAAGFIDRPVTVMEGVLPSALPLTKAVLNQAGTGWTVVGYNANVNGDGELFEAGPAVVYLISPEGERYEAGVIDAPVTVAGWDIESGSVWLQGNSTDGAPSQVLDMYTGEALVVEVDCPADDYGEWSVSDGADGWTVRARCEDRPLDAVWGPRGNVKSQVPGLVLSESGRSITDIGTLQVVYEFQRAPEEKFWAQRLGFPGERVALRLPAGYDDCYPLGDTGSHRPVVLCHLDDGQTLWELSLDGGTATPLMDEAKRAQVAAALGHAGEDGAIEVTQVCFAGSVPVAIVGGLERPAAVRLDTAQIVGDPQGTVESCAPGDARAVVLSAYGSLWSVDLPSGAATVLVEPPSRTDGRFVVGANALFAVRMT